jgi:hypothetical protein
MDNKLVDNQNLKKYFIHPTLVVTIQNEKMTIGWA